MVVQVKAQKFYNGLAHKTFYRDDAACVSSLLLNGLRNPKLFRRILRYSSGFSRRKITITANTKPTAPARRTLIKIRGRTGVTGTEAVSICITFDMFCDCDWRTDCSWLVKSM